MAGKTPNSSAKRSTTASKSSSRKSSAAKKSSSARTTAAKSGTRAKRSSSSASRNGSKRSGGSTASRSTRSAASSNGKGVVDTVKSVASKAAAPAAAVGAAAVGIAGGIALKSRTRRKTVLGVPLPRSVGKGISDFDGKAIVKSVGQASKRFAKTTKNVSKDLERAGDQAERIGKILD
jgi:hypothetical protein